MAKTNDLPNTPHFAVTVTEAEINTAVPKNSGHCMVSDAVKRSYLERFKRKAYGVSTDLQTIRFTDRAIGARIIYLTPPVAQRALLQFDEGIKPTPFTFRLRGGQIVKSKAKLEEEQENGTRTKRKPTKKQQAAMRKAQAIQVERRRMLKALEGKPKLHTKSTNHDTAGNIQTKVGGKAPPAAALSGNRRQFGVRRMGNLNGPTQ